MLWENYARSLGGDTVAKYACPKCGKTSELPDFCCGVPMAQKGSYACKSCGSSSPVKKMCCGEEMQQV